MSSDKQMERLSYFRIQKNRKRNCERVRMVLSEIKDIMRTEYDLPVKKALAEAGAALNKILLK